jgi:putative ABC transport system substrate-binding protein
MKRRDLIGIAAALVPSTLRAQSRPGNGVLQLGLLIGWREDDPEVKPYITALKQGLEVLGWHEGGNLKIEWRWAGGDAALFERYAAELVALNPDALLASTSRAVAALRRQTKTIPIIFVLIADPIGQGFVMTLARPGGNVTGFSEYDPPMTAKGLGMLTQIAPGVAHVAVLYNPPTMPFAGSMLRTLELAAPSFSVSIEAAPVENDAEIEATLAALAREDRAGVLTLSGIFTFVHRDAIVASAARHRLPAVYFAREVALSGGLMSYGVDVADIFHRSADYVDRILKGAKPGDLPVQNPTKFQMVVNLKTAKALGLSVPPALLAQADEVIE